MSTNQATFDAKQTLDTYLKELQKLLIQSNDDHQIQKHINKYLLLVTQNSGYKEFYLGEQCFYKKDYKRALQYYKQSKNVPSYQFYYCRAAAFLLKENNRTKQALISIKKALDIIPEDFYSLSFITSLLKTEHRGSEAQQWDNILQKMHRKYKKTPLEGPLPLSQIELDELTLLNDIQPEDLISDHTTDIDTLLKDDYINSVPYQKNIPSSKTYAWEKTPPDVSHEYDSIPTNKSSTHRFPPRSPVGSNFTSMPYNTGYSPTATQNDDNVMSGQNFNEEFSEDLPFYDEFSLDTDLLTDDFITEEIDLSSSQPEEEIVNNLPDDFSLEQIPPLPAINTPSQSSNGYPLPLQKHYERYLTTKNPERKDNCLYIPKKSSKISNNTTTIASLLDHMRKNSGDIYFRWNNKGVVINPNIHFLENFHEDNFFITDIDYVIVTQNNSYSYAELKLIHEMNHYYNTIGPQSHTIQYHLHPQAYHNTSTILSPKMKYNAVYSLDLYSDPTWSERLPLGTDITMHYFASSASNTIDLRFELHVKSKEKPLTLGYFPSLSWNQMLTYQLTNMDIIVIDLENEVSINKSDILNILSNLHPRLLLCRGDYGDANNNILEMIRTLRQEHPEVLQKSTFLPSNDTLLVNLLTSQIYCSANNEFIAPHDILVTKSAETNGELNFLCTKCFA